MPEVWFACKYLKERRKESKERKERKETIPPRAVEEWPNEWQVRWNRIWRSVKMISDRKMSDTYFKPLLHRTLPVGENIQKWRPAMNHPCGCNYPLETHQYLFSSCPFAQSAWFLTDSIMSRLLDKGFKSTAQIRITGMFLYPRSERNVIGVEDSILLHPACHLDLAMLQSHGWERGPTTWGEGNVENLSEEHACRAWQVWRSNVVRSKFNHCLRMMRFFSEAHSWRTSPFRTCWEILRRFGWIELIEFVVYFRVES